MIKFLKTSKIVYALVVLRNPGLIWELKTAIPEVAVGISSDSSNCTVLLKELEKKQQRVSATMLQIVKTACGFDKTAKVQHQQRMLEFANIMEEVTGIKNKPTTLNESHAQLPCGINAQIQIWKDRLNSCQINDIHNLKKIN